MNPICSCLLLTSIAANFAFAGETTSSKQAPPPVDDSWRFTLALPGWMAGLEGDIGIRGISSRVDLSPEDIIRGIDMAAMVRGEASKGRFGITCELIYLSLSDGVGSNTVIKKLDVRVDEIIGDLGVRWRLLESDRGYLDIIGGVRYVNIYQNVSIRPNSERIEEVSTALVDGGLREIAKRLLEREIEALEGKDPTVPTGPVAGSERTPIINRVREIINSRKAELAAAVQAQTQASTAEIRARAQARVNTIRRDVSRKIARELESRLDQTKSRTDDWFDPYIGLRARYNFTDRFYVAAKGDVGGFGVGSDFTWQAEASLGYQLTPRVFVEAGYRALSIDYEGDGLTYDTITRGAQIMLGVTF